MRVLFHPRFDREWPDIPQPIREWAEGWIRAAQAPNASLPDALKGAEKLKGGKRKSKRKLQNCYVRKWRRKFPHGEYRLVLKAEEEKEPDQIMFVCLGPRESVYETAARRM